jgi:hypothetical protein
VNRAPNAWQAIERTKSDPALAAKAQQRFAEQAQHLFHPHKVELSASAAGSCSLELWAKLNHKLDIPEDYVGQALKMDGGTLYGAWLAALFAVGYEDEFAGASVEVEVEGEHDGIPGHVEIVVNDSAPADENLRWMIEIKTSYWGGAVTESGPFKHSKEFHVLQAAKEALIVNAPGFSVLNVYPAATKNKNPTPFIQDDFVTAEWATAVATEYRRLERALDPVAPAADPPEAWRCNFCRFSACSRNKNPLNPTPSLPMAAARS